MPPHKNLLLLFLAVFLFRLFFGLCQSYWSDYDEKQSYLTGLKFYTTGTWPYFGPDAGGSENSFHSQVPGALEGLVIGIPLYILPIPEAPYILLNLLSAFGVLLLAWYIHRRIPKMPFLWLVLWIAVVPWGLHYPSHISNMSYLFFSGILFFLGFLESVPLFSLKLISLSWANALMGFSFFWIMQFHLSFVFLAPLVLFSLLTQIKNRWSGKNFIYFLAGSLPPLSLAIPTYLQYGFQRINSHSGFVTAFNWDNVLNLYLLLPRFLSLACFEVPSFIGAHTSDRLVFLNSHPWLWIPGALLFVGGALQAVVLFLAWFGNDHPPAGWPEMKWLSLTVFAVVYGSFWFTVKPPLSHIYLVLFPLVMIYSCYVWSFFAANPRFRMAAKVFIVLGIFFQLGYALAVAPQNSLYTQRSLVAKAIQEKNYHLVGERTPGDFY